MYGYRTNHKILTSYLNWQIENLNTFPKPTLDVVSLANRVRKKKNTIIGQYIVYLESEGFFKFEMVDAKNHVIEITDKGVSASTGNYFKIKQDIVFWKGLFNLLMVGSTLAIAITTIITLLSVEPRIKQIEKELEQLKQLHKVLPEITSPIPATKLETPTPPKPIEKVASALKKKKK